MDMGQDTNMDYGGQGFLPKTAFSLVLPSPLVAILPNEWRNLENSFLMNPPHQ